MPTETGRTRSMDIEDFVAWMATWDDSDRYELLDGTVVARPPTTLGEEIIAQNVTCAVARSGVPGCRAFRKLLLRSPATDRFGAFPDVYVRCGPLPEGSRTWVDDAVAVFEVLSPSTLAIDRGYKQQQYLAMPGLQHYVLIHPREFRVETWSRDAAGAWSEFPAATTTRDGTVRLPALDLTIAMAELYADTDLLRAAS